MCARVCVCVHRVDAVSDFVGDQADWLYDKACHAVPALRTNPKLVTLGTTAVVAAATYYYIQ